MTDKLVPLLGGTLHNFSDRRCRCRDTVTPARDGASCEPCAKSRALSRCAVCGAQATVDVIPSAVEQRDKGTRPHSLCEAHAAAYAPLLGRAGQIVSIP